MADDALTLLKNKEFLGREFLTWLWYRVDKGGGNFTLPDGKPVVLTMGNRMVLAADPEILASTVTCHGESPDYREARLALAQGKKPVEARFHLEMEGEEWVVTLDSVWLGLKSVKTPSAGSEAEEDGIAGRMLEKVFLLRRVAETVDGLARLFATLRVSDKWEKSELPAIKAWVYAGRAALDGT